YTDERNYRNPFHRHELYREDLARSLDPVFPHRRWFHQQPLVASALWSEAEAGAADQCEAWAGGPDAVTPIVVTEGLYHVVVAATAADVLPPARLRVSLFTDRGDTELRRV